MRISDWSSDVCSSDLQGRPRHDRQRRRGIGMSDFSIRNIRADDDDDAAIAAIIRSVMPEFGADGPGFAIHDPEVAAMSHAYLAPRHVYFVVERAGVVMGGAGIAPLAGSDADTCELRKMYFLPAIRGKGAGAAMMQRCLEAARGFGFRRCYLEPLSGMDGAPPLDERSGSTHIRAPLGSTGHFARARYYFRDLIAP